MKTLIFLTAAMLTTLTSPASASTISFTAPAVVSGAFDVVVQAQDLFGGRDPLTDAILSYGFNVSISDPLILSFAGATSGPLFDPATAEPGTDVFGAASGLAVFPPVIEPLTLATLHFNTIGSGPATISISSDLNNPFQGLQFFNAPFQESIAGTVSVSAAASSAVPEPATLVLSGIGLLGVACVRRIRRRYRPAQTGQER
jgi:hypothetical protein